MRIKSIWISYRLNTGSKARRCISVRFQTWVMKLMSPIIKLRNNENYLKLGITSLVSSKLFKTVVQMKFVEAIKILNCWEYFMFNHKNQNSDPSLMKQVSNAANSCKLNPKEGRDQRNTKTAGFQPSQISKSPRFRKMPCLNGKGRQGLKRTSSALFWPPWTCISAHIDRHV